MKNFYLITILVVLMISIACSPPASAQNPPEYVGTWKGIDIAGLDITLIADETTYELDLYLNGTTTLLNDSQKGTHGTISHNVDCELNETHSWDGADWVSDIVSRTIRYSVLGNTMTFLYDETFPQAGAWVIGGDLIKQ